MSDVEHSERRRKGLCFKCNEKWFVNHVCSRKEMSVLIGATEEEPTAETSLFVEELEEEQEKIEPMGISLNSVVGITNQKTMKMLGTVNSMELIVMIDPEATNNFISVEAVKKLGLNCEESENFGVMLGNGEEILGQGVRRQVELRLQELSIVQDYFALELGISNVILGVQWLETLGPVTTNWKTQAMQFAWQGRNVILLGDPTLKRSKISLNAMLKVLKK